MEVRILHERSPPIATSPRGLFPLPASTFTDVYTSALAHFTTCTVVCTYYLCIYLLLRLVFCLPYLIQLSNIMCAIRCQMLHRG